MNIHPSKDILGAKGNELKEKKIVLCVTGSVAAVRCPEIARELMRLGAEVFAVMSSMAQKIIHPYLLEWATGNEVVTELTGKIEHVALAGEHPNKANLIIVAPATANTIGKIACGIDDTPVTSVVSTAFGSEIPILIVPAMHESLYRHPIVKENIEKLRALGVEVMKSRMEEGKAKIAETEEIVEKVIRQLTMEKDLSGKKVLVTAGATLEHIDPVRVITNKSSGKMGVAVAKEASSRGAEVTLIYGLGTAVPPKDAKVISVETTEQMLKAVVSELKSKKFDVMIATAAVADWTLKKPFSRKVSTHARTKLTLELKPTPKIIDAVKKVSTDTFLVPFKAEYNLSDEELIDLAYERMKEAQADLIVVNDVARPSVGFEADTNEVFIVSPNREVVHVPLTSKQKVAQRLLDEISEKWKNK
ncbi:MAG: bifunctional phosphopantothenoylcysteine decarboxylase/phosphopantothenate--cysteine ligase CoaBC [Thermoproteota archaeon]|nr:bifunctional phosphopantothenoylcysteine decarboxylase/phosphopantothenate--cysteine ligase CoaBC [Thermoproteota archaeon]